MRKPSAVTHINNKSWNILDLNKTLAEQGWQGLHTTLLLPWSVLRLLPLDPDPWHSDVQCGASGPTVCPSIQRSHVPQLWLPQSVLWTHPHSPKQDRWPALLQGLPLALHVARAFPGYGVRIYPIKPLSANIKEDKPLSRMSKQQRQQNLSSFTNPRQRANKVKL